MSSERRIRASRANGPNSLRHGLLARTVVLEDENLQSFTELLGAFERDLNPQNEIERALVEKIAVGRWRLLRIWAMERSTLETEMEKHDRATIDPGTRAALAFRTHLGLLLKMGQASSPSFQENTGEKNAFCQTTLVPKTDTNKNDTDKDVR